MHRRQNVPEGLRVRHVDAVEGRVDEPDRPAGCLVGIRDHTCQQWRCEARAAFLELAVMRAAVREGLGQADEHSGLCVRVHRDVRDDAQRLRAEERLVAQCERVRHDAGLVRGLEVGVARADTASRVEAQRRLRSCGRAAILGGDRAAEDRLASGPANFSRHGCQWRRLPATCRRPRSPMGWTVGSQEPRCRSRRSCRRRHHSSTGC